MTYPGTVGCTDLEPVGGAREQITHSALCFESTVHLRWLRTLLHCTNFQAKLHIFTLFTTQRTIWSNKEWWVNGRNTDGDGTISNHLKVEKSKHNPSLQSSIHDHTIMTASHMWQFWLWILSLYLAILVLVSNIIGTFDLIFWIFLKTVVRYHLGIERYRHTILRWKKV